MKKHVQNGWVDYQGIIVDIDTFYACTRKLASVSKEDMASWTREQTLAYWINAYNTFTIQAIIERYPIREWSLVGLFSPKNSILQISDVWSKLTFNAGGRQVTLGDIEHDILRQDFDEPRIHFAIVCASGSCPKLRSEVYRPEIIDSQLEDQAIEFINDSERGLKWNGESNHAAISKIFKWFKDDFQGARPVTGNPLMDYIIPYIQDQAVRKEITEAHNIKISYLPYDWHLNELPTKSPPGNSND